MKILHIISYQRSGSTVLGLAFGQYKSVSYLGEISAVFTHNWDKVCSCRTHESTHVTECPVWGPIFEQSRSVLEKYNFWEAASNDGALKKERPLFLKKAFNQMKRKEKGPELEAAQEIIKIVFEHATKVEKAEIIVDSSKDLSYLQILKNLFQDEYFPLHLIRDSRGVVYSARKSPSIPGKATPLTLWRSSRIALGWGFKNLLIENYIKNSSKKLSALRYEDWCKNPQKTTDGIIKKLSGQTQGSPFIDKTTLRVEPCHSYFGNRSRENTGSLTIKPDESWKKGLQNKHLISSTLTSTPFLKKYGYSVGI